MDGIQLEKLYVLIEAQTSEFNSQMTKVNGRIDSMSQNIKSTTSKASKSFSLLGKGILAVFSIKTLFSWFNKFLEITKQTENFKKTLATAFEPLVTSLQPVFTDIITAIAKIVAFTTGVLQAMGLLTKATTKQTAAVVKQKRAYAGFDELVTVSEDQADATAAEGTNLIDTNMYLQQGIAFWEKYGKSIVNTIKLVATLGAIFAGIFAVSAILGFLNVIGSLVLAFFDIEVVVSGLSPILLWLMQVVNALGQAWFGLTAGIFGGASLAIFAAVVAAVIAVGAAIWQLWNEASTRGEEFRANVTEAFQGLMDSLNLFYTSTIKPIVDIIILSLLMIWNNGLKPLWDGFVTAVGGIINVLMVLWTYWLKPIVDFFIKIFGPIIVAVIGGAIAIFSGLLTVGLQIVGGLLEAFGRLLNWFSTVLKGGWSGLFKSLGNFFVDFVNVVITQTNMLIKALISPFNLLIQGWNATIGKVAGKIPEISINIPLIPKLANGGMLNAGSLFVAGEAGAELVGSYNGQTTVMPLENSDFTASMKSAVIAGVIEGIAASSTSSSTTLVVDGMTLAKAVESNLNKLSTVQGGLKIAL